MGIEMMKKINYVLDRGQKIRLLILLAAIIVGALFETLGVSAVLPLITVVTNPDVLNEDNNYSKLAKLLNIGDVRTFILLMAIALIIVYIVKNIYILFMYNLQYRYTYNNQRRVSYRLMECYLSQDYLFHVSHNVAELQRNVGGDVNGFFQVVLNVIQLFTEGVTCAALVIFLLMQDVATTIAVIVLLSLFMLVVVLIFRKRMTRLGEENRRVGALLYKWISQSFGGIKEVKVTNREKYFLENYDAAYRRQVSIQRRQLLYGIAPRPIMETVCICGLLGFISARIFLGADIRSFVPIVSVFAVAAIRMLPSFNRISNNVTAIMYNKPSLEAVYKDLQGIEELRQKVLHDNTDTTIIDFKTGIEVKNISFYYPANPDKTIISDVSLTIPKNKSVALIGPSGSGKTTLADVILGVLEPQRGHIYADDIDVYEHLHAWHKIVGYIPQAIYLMDDTIRANVAFGENPKDIDDERLWKALKEAQLDEYVREQKDGLDTIVGDRGIKLSGGQRQRIGIARALYRRPEVLILDEATSALDNDTETAVMESIDALSGTKTMIIIAHRLTTIRNCDIIYEVKDGKLRQRDKNEVLAGLISDGHNKLSRQFQA